MKLFELTALALRGWKRIAFPGLFFWIAAVFLLGSSAITGWSIWYEKSRPCTITASAQEVRSDELAKLLQESDILNVSELYSLTNEVAVGGFAGEWELTGVDSRFLNGELKSGTIYPDETGMPWLVVNDSALRLLHDSSDKPLVALDGVNWLSQPVTILSSEKAVIGKICGVLASSEDDAPAVYLSVSAASMLAADETGSILLEVRNAGCQEATRNTLQSLGYQATDTNEETQRKWALEEQKVLQGCLAGGVALLSAVCLFWQSIRYDALANRDEYKHLKKLTGVSIIELNAIRCAASLLIGALIAGGMLVLQSVLT